VLHAACRIGSRTLRHPLLWAIAAAAFVAIFALDLPFPLIVLGAGVVGAIGGRSAPKVFSLARGHAASTSAPSIQLPPALIDDDTPTPAHAKFRWRRLVTVCVVFLALWVLALGTLAALWGWESTLAQMGWFFTKAALLTFGGAYAVLPYVYQGAVETFGWLTPAQMIDGLALGESTPGPLIMVVAFVGFVGGWTTALLGPDLLPLAGAIAAAVVTLFTFLPSFLFILAGGPLIESTHGQLRFTAPLTAITAAVVGVIVNLAVFFAWHVFWPTGWQPALATTGLDAVAVAIFVAAAVALFRYKAHVIPVILGSGTAGLALALLR
jgi:chromate transporter